MGGLSGLLKSLGSKVLGGLSGPAGWLVGLLVEKAISFVTSLVKGYLARRERDKKDQQQEVIYNEEIKKPGATLEEIRLAGDDFLNRREP